ncbi:MAG TPA: UDP-N-acetylmuramoyl-L-alanine--D-glutamate ligase [Spirochaetia bacterium]|nr:UDP-N-acetylmuramoyl-L-alanine--D-glutamate ligase [Spirochaetia bacterium]
MKPSDLSGSRVTVMGLGLHGGGLESARYLCRHGAQVTVTDTRSEDVLRTTIDKLDGLPIRYVLGRHEEKDFSSADIVIKNPAVPRTAPMLATSRRIETDISLFLKMSKNLLIAITGTKGKSTVVSALHAVLRSSNPAARLGGNITVSPLSFLDQLETDAPVVLELSSFQLGDLTLVDGGAGVKLLRPSVAAVTNILPDHQNYYHSMERYVADKRIIYQGQGAEQFTLCNYDQPEGGEFARETPARVRYFSRNRLPVGAHGAYLAEGSGWIRLEAGEQELVPAHSRLQGEHARINLLIAGLAAVLFGIPASRAAEVLAAFAGVEHRMETFAEQDGVRFINDSAATIPEATSAAVTSLSGRVLLIAGGTDKELQFEGFPETVSSVAELHLLAGSATEKLIPALEAEGIGFNGPYDTLEECLAAVVNRSTPGTTVLFSPGCASFGMFLNEFDRGSRFKELVRELLRGR